VPQRLPSPPPSKASKPPSRSGAKNSPNPVKAPSPQKASSAKATPNPSIVGASLSPKPTESPKGPPPSPRSPGLRSAGGVPLSGDSAQPQLEGSFQRIPRVNETLAKDPDFIKAGFHIGRFITTAVNTEADHADIQALRNDLNSASTRINVSNFYLYFCFTTFS
jgi:hypothetical protein